MAGLLSPDSGTALGLLGAGLVRGDFGGGLLAANQWAAGMKERQREEQIAQMRMQEMQMRMEDFQRQRGIQQQLQEAARQSVITPEKANSLSMGPMPDGSEPPMVAPGLDTRGFINRAFQVDPFEALKLQQSLAKDETPLTVAPGASLVDRRTMKPVFTAPKEPDLPSAVREYEYARAQGYQGTFDQYTKDQKRAGASNVSVAVNAEKSLLNDIAGGLGKSISGARDNAQAALGTINTVNRLNDALDSGQVVAGPGASFRQFGLQVGNMLGVAGKDGQEKLLNTRQAIQSLAQLELDAAQQMKGQGQITEAERAIIRRAASGDIDGMTAQELRLLGGVLDRTARTKIRSYQSQVAPLRQNPNAAPLAPFLDVPEPEVRRPASAPTILRFDAQGNPIR